MPKAGLPSVLAVLFLLGCGGSGGSNGDSLSRLSSVTSAKAAFQFARTNLAAEIGAVGAMPHDWTLVPELGIYRRGVPVDQNTIRIELAQAPDATPLLGTIVAEITDPFPYPATAEMTVDLTIDGVHTEGTLTGTLLSDTRRRVIADVQFNPPQGRLQYDLTLDQTTGSVEGSVTGTVNNQTVTLTNIRKGEDGSTFADAAVNGHTVHLHWQNDGSGTAETDTGVGELTVAWNRAGAGTIAFPNGHVESFSSLQNL
jgi:hypothetical protein